uniref:VWFA domain-containing protein n=1 Tax=Eptatretus burgeri TaxID=7764 RepID=A0A8C4Q2A8_EPTBU
MMARLLCLATCVFAGLSSAVSFNLETPSPIVFSTFPSEAFGYKLVQLNGKHNNWLVVSAPSSKNSSGDLQGKLYRCPVTSPSSSPGRCQQIFTTLPNDFLQVKDLHLGLTLVKDTSLPHVLACGPTGELDCGSNAFLRGSCLVHDDSFRIVDHFNVGLAQGCPMHPVDVAVLMDGSGSVNQLDFKRAKKFVIELMKSFKNRDAQLAVVQYSTRSRIELSFSQYKNNPEKIISAINQKTGGTNTATAIKFVLHRTRLLTPTCANKRRALSDVKGDLPTDSDVPILCSSPLGPTPSSLP